MENRIKLGLIGVGVMGSRVCKQIVGGKTPEMELVAVAAHSASTKAWVEENLPTSVQVFSTGEALIESGCCDAVMILTPHYTHPKLAIAALQKGMHVLCEKPVGVYTKEIHQIHKAAEESGKVFAMVFGRRLNPINIKIKEVLDSGVLGPIRRVNWIASNWYRTMGYYNSNTWRGTWKGEGGGVLLNQCPHDLDLVQWFFGMPNKIRAFCHNGKWHDIEVEDDVSAYMEFPSGATGVFVASTCDLPGTDRLEITGQYGKLIRDGKTLTLWNCTKAQYEEIVNLLDSDFVPEFEPQVLATEGESGLHADVLNAFAGNILRGEPLVAEGIEGIKSLTISNAMYLSSWLDETVTIPFDEDLFLQELNRRRGL